MTPPTMHQLEGEALGFAGHYFEKQLGRPMTRAERKAFSHGFGAGWSDHAEILSAVREQTAHAQKPERN